MFRLFAMLSGLALAGVTLADAPVHPAAALAQAELESYLRTTNPALIEQLVARAQRGLEADAQRAPQDQRIANVILAHGLDGAGIAALLEPRGIALVGLAARCPMKSGRMPAEIEIPQAALGALTDGVATRVDGAFERERKRFSKLAQRMSAGADEGLTASPAARDLVARYREVAASGELAAYRLEVMGTRAALFALSRAPPVRAVFVDENAQRVAEARAIERNVQEWRNPPSSTAIHDITEPPPGTAPSAPSEAVRAPASQWKRLPIPQETPAAADYRALLMILKGYAEPQDIERHFGKSHEELRKDAKAIPDARRAAMMFLRQPLNPDEARQFLEQNHFELHGCVLRDPALPSMPSVVTLDQRTLARWPGGIVHRIERATFDERMRHARRASATGNPVAREMYQRAAASTSYRVFRIDVIGRVRDLARQLDAAQVLAIFYGPTAGSADGHDSQKRFYERAGVADESDPDD